MPVFGSSLAVSLGRAPEPDGLEYVCVASPVPCPAQFSSEALTPDDRRRLPPPVCLSFLDPWWRVVQLHQPARN